MSKEYSPENDNSTTEIVLICTDAYKEAIKEFEEKFDEAEDKLDELDSDFDRVNTLPVIRIWRQAIVACKYSLEDIHSVFDDWIGDDKLLSQVAEAILIEMGSLAIPTLNEISMSENEDISAKAKELIAKIERTQVVEPAIRQWINAVWKYLRKRNK
jgi:hypothetical protein